MMNEAWLKEIEEHGIAVGAFVALMFSMIVIYVYWLGKWSK